MWQRAPRGGRLGGQHTAFDVKPVARKITQRSAKRSKPGDDAVLAAPNLEVGLEQPDAAAEAVLAAGRPDRGVLDEVSHAVLDETLVRLAHAEEQPGTQRAGDLGPHDGDTIDFRLAQLHGAHLPARAPQKRPDSARTTPAPCPRHGTAHHGRPTPRTAVATPYPFACRRLPPRPQLDAALPHPMRRAAGPAWSARAVDRFDDPKRGVLLAGITYATLSRCA